MGWWTRCSLTWPRVLELGRPRVHFRLTDSTNARARELAAAGAPHGTLVTADAQSAGRGRQGRSWVTQAGRSLSCSLVLRNPPALVSLVAGVAVAEVCGSEALLKWPNDVLLGGRKVAGILVEGRPQEGWAVVGIGINVALDLDQLDDETRQRAGTLGLGVAELESVLGSLLAALEHWLARPESEMLSAVRARDALLGQSVRWSDGEGTGAGIDEHGELLVLLADRRTVALNAGEVHIGR
jgi:BirA family transcriptional regulator, biotin operon repressor / biotin---[acetyl-CoA-carboxylase] ligase